MKTNLLLTIAIISTLLMLKFIEANIVISITTVLSILLYVNQKFIRAVKK